MTLTATSRTQTVRHFEDHLGVPIGAEEVRFHYVWLRDNCWCSECRVDQSQERRLYTADVPLDITARESLVDHDGTLRIRWSDDHMSAYSVEWLRTHDYSERARAGRRHAPVLWDASIDSLPTFEHGAVLGTPEGQLAYLDAIRDYGVAVVRNTPAIPGEVERFAQSLGYLRETAFERIHNVRHDPAGYSVAHTSAELVPHTDLPSYSWPPSIQLLHFLVNDATGGESTLTDGWAVLAELRADDPAAFETLCRVPVPFKVFSDDEDTAATAPLVQLDSEGRVRTFRFSNHLVQPIDTRFDDVPAFYAAYRKLGRLIGSGRYKVAFKTSNGDLLTVHGHRVLHGRLAFDPTSGARHLQDAYMDYDDLMARRRVLQGTHKPLSALDGVA